MMNDKITIGIPIYQVEKYVTKCIESVLCQTYENLEIMAVDDCGTDKSIYLVEQLQHSHPRGNQICIVHHTENKGLAECRNTIIEHANGKYIYFLDSDDYIEPEAIELLYAAAEEAQSQVTYGSFRHVDTSGNNCRTGGQLPNKTFLKPGEFQHYICQDLKTHVNITSWNILFLTQFIRDNQLRFHFRKAEDFVFFTDFYPLSSRVVFLSDITYNYLIREDSITSRQSRQTIPAEEMEIGFNIIEYITCNAQKLVKKDYYDVHCAKLMKHKLNIVCAYLKHRHQITPSIADERLHHVMLHPTTFMEVLKFRQYKFMNLAFFVLGHLPVKIMLSICGVIARKGWA